MASLLLDENEPVYGWDELPLPSLYPRRHRELLRALIGLLRCAWPEARVCGHRDFAAKACPCYDVHQEWPPP